MSDHHNLVTMLLVTLTTCPMTCLASERGQCTASIRTNRAECPPGTKEWQSRCYGVTNTKQTWENSLQVCQALGGKMAFPETAEKNEFIKTEVMGSNLEYNYEAAYLKCQGQALLWDCMGDGTYVNWSPTSPSNGTDENCIIMYRSTGTWSDSTCWRSRPALCEFEKQPRGLLHL